MSFEIIKSGNQNCRNSVGGIREIYIGKFIGDKFTYTIGSTPTVYTFLDVEENNFGSYIFGLYDIPVGHQVFITFGDGSTATATVVISNVLTGAGVVVDIPFYPVSGHGGEGGGTIVDITATPIYPDGTITSFTKPDDYFLSTFPQPNEVPVFSSVGEFSREKRTSFYTIKIGMTFYQLSGELNDFLTRLGRGTFLIMVLDQNGRYFLIGPNFGCDLITSTPTTGKNAGDLNGAQIEFETKEQRVPYEVTAAAAAQILEHNLQFEETLKPVMEVEFYTSPADPVPQMLGYWNFKIVGNTSSFISTNGLLPTAFAPKNDLCGIRLSTYLNSGIASTASLTWFNMPLEEIDAKMPFDYATASIMDNMLVYFATQSTAPNFVDTDNNLATDLPLIILESNSQNALYYGQSFIDVQQVDTSKTSMTLRLTKSVVGPSVPEIIAHSSVWGTFSGTTTPDPIDPTNSILWTVGRGVHTVSVVTSWGTFSHPALPKAYKSEVITVY